MQLPSHLSYKHARLLVLKEQTGLLVPAVPQQSWNPDPLCTGGGHGLHHFVKSRLSPLCPTSPKHSGGSAAFGLWVRKEVSLCTRAPGQWPFPQNQCTHVPSPRGQRSPTSVPKSPWFRDLTLDISDAHILTQRQSDSKVTPHPGWQMEVHRARPCPQAVLVPTVQLPWGLREPGGQVLPPFLLGSMPGSPLLGVEAVWGPAHLLRMSCLSAAH